ncbi:MAG: hypothetical protein PF440_07500 [Thiomicrorhabdus sp.]|jgi:hypothetical protein|nr:hypothetical protein [Thiomicrorhabdus sp.]
MDVTATLNQEEITVAIKNYVKEQGFDLDNKSIDIDMTATRKPKGFTAAVTISSDVAASGSCLLEPEAKDVVAEEKATVTDPELTAEEQKSVDDAEPEAEEESLFGS